MRTWDVLQSYDIVNFYEEWPPYEEIMGSSQDPREQAEGSHIGSR